MKIKVINARNKKYNNIILEFGKIVDTFENFGTVLTQYELIKFGNKIYIPSIKIGKYGCSATLCLFDSYGTINFDEIQILD